MKTRPFLVLKTNGMFLLRAKNMFEGNRLKKIFVGGIMKSYDYLPIILTTDTLK